MTITLLALLLIGCNKAPSREEALAAFRRAKPGMDSSQATIRVWADGPPWFSCAEVVSKLRSASDHAVVRDQVGHWRALIVADWVTLRDTAAGPVVEPGWCTAALHDSARHVAAGWRKISGDSLPSGGLRRGWDVSVGTTHVQVKAKTTVVGADSARAVYRFTIAPNENGVATGADRDTVERTALLTKVDGQWRLQRLEDRH